MTIQLLCAPPAVFSPCEFRIKWARSDWELRQTRQTRQLRRAVFCAEQGVFVGDDRDAVDAADSHARTLVAVACVAGESDQVVGTVRLHTGPTSNDGNDGSDSKVGDTADGLWWGSRLAVHAAFRHHARLGSALIQLAVGSARARGCQLFLAHVQAQHQALFERLHWRALKPLQLHGRPHLLMQAGLDHYPHCHDPVTRFVVRSVVTPALNSQAR